MGRDGSLNVSGGEKRDEQGWGADDVWLVISPLSLSPVSISLRERTLLFLRSASNRSICPNSSCPQLFCFLWSPTVATLLYNVFLPSLFHPLFVPSPAGPAARPDEA